MRCVVKFAFLLLFALVGAQGTYAAAPAPDLAARLLASHNAERARLGVPPLHWSPQLVADAQLWAKHLAQTNRFEHAPDAPKGHEQGENLWMGTTHAYTPEEMVDAWVEERVNFINGIFPNVSRTGNWHDVGHYTQLIWANTTDVGCALASNANDDYLVCRYSAPGNWDDEPAIPQRKRAKL